MPASKPWVEEPVNDSEDPIQLQALPQYACPHVTLKTREPVVIPERSAMAGWQSAVREKAVNEAGTPWNAYYPVYRTRLRYEEGLCPSDCVECRWDENAGQSSEWTQIPGRFLAGNRPPKCDEQEILCRSELILGTVSTSATAEGSSEYASKYAADALQANLPWAKINCDGRKCAATSFAYGEADCGSKDAFCGKVSVNVPLYSLLGKQITIESQAHERSEVEFVR